MNTRLLTVFSKHYTWLKQSFEDVAMAKKLFTNCKRDGAYDCSPNDAIIDIFANLSDIQISNPNRLPNWYSTKKHQGYFNVGRSIDTHTRTSNSKVCNQIPVPKLEKDILVSYTVKQWDKGNLESFRKIYTPHKLTLHKQSGMTLIEILIAMLIGAFLLGGVIQIFLGSKQTNRMQESLSRLQENGRFALDFLAEDIRMAGFIGCNSAASLTNTNTPPKTPNTLNTPTSFLYDFRTAIQGFESTSATEWTPSINAAITSPMGRSDVITIRRADDIGFSITAHASNTADLTLDATTATTANLKNTGFLKQDGNNNCRIAVVSDCSAAAVFQVSNIATNVLSHETVSDCTAPKNSTNDLGKTYVGAQVFPIDTINYYVRFNPENQASLYRKINSDNAQELIEGVENMQILYGEDTDVTPDGTANRYVPADDVSDMTKVVSVRISLLVASVENNITTEPIPYTYNGSTNTPDDNDRKIRRVFNTTIALRNRLR